MKLSIIHALGLALALPLAAPIALHAQTPEFNNRREGEATLSGTVLSFDAKTRALKIAVESRAGAAAPSQSPFVTLFLPPDLQAPANTTKRGTSVRATGSWDAAGTLQARAIRMLTVEEALAPPSGRIAAGWPKTVPGYVQSSAMPAQLDGEGPLEIVVASLGNSHDVSEVNEGPVQLWAFRADGRTVADWPVDMIRASERPPDSGPTWHASPTIADLDGNVTDEVVMPLPPIAAR